MPDKYKHKITGTEVIIDEETSTERWATLVDPKTLEFKGLQVREMLPNYWEKVEENA